MTERFLLHNKNGRGYRLTRRGVDILYFGRSSQQLAGTAERPGLGENCIYLISRTISILPHAIWTFNCNLYRLAEHIHHLIMSKIANSFGIIRQRHHLFKNCTRTFLIYLHSIFATTQSRCHVETEACNFITKRPTTWDM